MWFRREGGGERGKTKGRQSGTVPRQVCKNRYTMTPMMPKERMPLRWWRAMAGERASDLNILYGGRATGLSWW
jgi:hypothetical protein